MGSRQTLHTECTSLRSLSNDDFQFLAEVIKPGWGIVPHIFTEVINEKRDFVTLMSTITRTDCPNDLFTPSGGGIMIQSLSLVRMNYYSLYMILTMIYH